MADRGECRRARRSFRVTEYPKPFRRPVFPDLWEFLPAEGACTDRGEDKAWNFINLKKEAFSGGS